jgi:hypothetical protein
MKNQPTITRTPDGEYLVVAPASVPAEVVASLAASDFESYAAWNHYVENEDGVRGVGYTARLIDWDHVVIEDHTV